MSTIQAAQDILASNPAVFDTETTGLGSDAVVVEIAAVDANSIPLIDTLISPVSVFPYEVSKINGITGYELKHSGRGWDIAHMQVWDILQRHSFVAFNASFDVRVLEQTNHHSGERPFFGSDSEVMVFDLMELANRHFHKHLEWDEGQSKFKRLSLAKCCEIGGIEFNGPAHRALVDANAALALLHYIANGGE